MKIEVYTDGSATTKDKPGGYGWVIVADGKFHSEGSGFLEKATNNDAELEAAIMGLANAFKMAPKEMIYHLGPYPPEETGIPHHNVSVTLVSDSQIVLGWLSGTYRFKQLAKQQKYFQFMRLKKMMNVTGRWVEGHTGDEWNERCDKLAGIERRKAMGIEPKKKTSKSTLMLKAIKEIGAVIDSVFVDKSMDDDSALKEIRKICEPFL